MPLRVESGVQFYERTRLSPRPRLSRIVPFPRRFGPDDVIEVSSHMDTQLFLAHVTLHATLPRQVQCVPTGFSEAEVLYVDCSHHRLLHKTMRGVAEHLVNTRCLDNVESVIENTLKRIKRLNLYSESDLHSFFDSLPQLVLRLPQLALIVIDDLGAFHFESIVKRRSLERHVRLQLRLLREALKKCVVKLPVVYSKTKWATMQEEKWNNDLTFRLGIEGPEYGYVQSGSSDRFDLGIRVSNCVEVTFA